MSDAGGGDVHVRILGPVGVTESGAEIPLRPNLSRLLALLVVADGGFVPLDRIAEHLADGELDGSRIRTAVSRLRKVVGDRIETVSGGYRLQLAEDELDAARFEVLRDRARSAPPAESIDMLSEALRLWRGRALEGLADLEWATATAQRLDSARATATEDLADALIAEGRFVEAGEVLATHLGEHPYRERPVELMMRALAGDGRVPDALRVFQRFRVTLRDEMGLDPTADLQAREAELLGLGETSPGTIGHAATTALPAPSSTTVPAGTTATITFLFTDIEGSTRLWDDDPEAMAEALLLHDEICRASITSHEGVVFATGGDGFAAAFRRATDAAGAAIDIQSALAEVEWPPTASVRVRMGLHTGEAHEREGDYFGPPVNRAARIMSAGNGGQILASGVTAELLEDAPGIELIELGAHHLPGIADPVKVLGLFAGRVPWIDRPLRTVEGGRGNLPASLDDFVGRGDELRDLASELRSSRLLTIAGAGGVGKTRLAIEVAGAVSDEFPDGVWLVELAAVAEPAAVLQSVGGTLGVRQEAGVTPLESIVAALRPQRTLLILDNAEHLLTTVAEIARAIAERCPASRVIVTSREPLGVRGEHIHALTSLDDDEGYELFCDRARATDATTSVGDEDRRTITAICRRLDGIPLAIELAAARTRSLTPTDVLSRLDDRFRLLRGGRSGVDRHQTLQGALSWSYQLLSDEERLLFDRLSVFAGEFALLDAEQVCWFGALDEADVVDVLASLVGKSMVVAGRRGTSMRFRLLETIRQYGADQLDQRHESALLRDRHLDHYLTRAHDIAAKADSPDEREAHRQFDLDFDNFRAAFDWAWSAPDLERAAGLAVALIRIEVLNTEVAEWTRLVRDATPAEHVAADELTIQTALSQVLAGDSAAAMDDLTRLADGTHLPRGFRSAAWNLVATAHLNTGDARRGLDAVRTAMELADDDLASQYFSATIGCWCAWGCEPGAVAGFAATANEAAELSGVPSRHSWAQWCLGAAALVDDRVDAARSHFEESLRLGKATNGVAEGQALQGLAAAAAASGDADEIAEAFGEALAQLHRTRFWMYIWIVVENLAVCWFEQGDLEGSAILFGHLEAGDHAHGVFSTDRRRCLARLTGDPVTTEAMHRGAALTRDDLVASAIDRLADRDIGSTV